MNKVILAVLLFVFLIALSGCYSDEYRYYEYTASPFSTYKDIAIRGYCVWDDEEPMHYLVTCYENGMSTRFYAYNIYEIR